MFHCNGWCFPWTLAAVGGTSICLRRVEAAGDLRRDRAARRDPPVRRADRDEHGAQRADELQRRSFDHRCNMLTAGAAPPAAVLARWSARLRTSPTSTA